jgi:AcrR family transcriptional regulator
VKVQDTERRIIAACLQLCRDGGPGAITTRAVAAAAGVNEVTLFRHFATKSQLVRAMVADSVQRIARDMPMPVRGDTLAEDLTTWAAAYIDHLTPMADMVMVGIAEARWDDDLRAFHSEFARQVPAALAERFQALADAGEIPAADFSTLAQFFFGLLMMRVITAHVIPEPLDRDRVARMVGHLFATGLKDTNGVGVADEA